MANIDNLNFKVILDDEEFNKKVEKDIKAAKKLNTQLSKYLEVRAKLKTKSSGLSAKEAAERKRQIDLNTKEAVSQEKVTQAKLKTAKAQQQLNNAMKRGASNYSSHHGLLGELGTLAASYFSIRGVSAFTQQLVEVTGQYEAQRAALRAMLQDQAGADRLLEQFQELALVSPYTFQNLAKYGKQLAAYGVPIEDIYDTTKRLADVASGVGVDLSRIILAYGQVMSATFLKGTELRQFTEAGIPLLEMLADEFTKLEGKTVSVGDVFQKISDKKVSFDMVAQAFRAMTDEGGKFYNMQEVLAETVQGKVSNLRDAYEKMLYTIGENQSDIIKGTVDGLRVLMENYEIVGKILAGLVTTFGTYKAALIAVNAIQKTKLFVSEYMAMGKALGFATANQIAFNTAAKANIYIALASAIVGVITALVTFNKKKREALTESGKAAKAYEDEEKALKKLFDTAKNEGKSKDERRKAISKINTEYGQYLDSLIDERDSVDKLAESYAKLSDALGKKYLQQQKELLTGSQMTAFNEAQSALYGSIKDVLDKSGLTDGVKGQLTAEIQQFLTRFSRYWSAQDILGQIYQKIANAGGSIKGRPLTKLFDAAKEFKQTQTELQLAEKGYEEFAKGYQAHMDAIAASSGKTAEEVRTRIADIVGRIEAGNAEIAKYEKRAKTQGLTDAERKTLKALREQNDEDRNEYKELAGVDYTKTQKNTDKAAKELEKQGKRLARETVKAEDEATRAGIEAMDDGHKKRMALLELQHKERMQQIVWDYEDEVEKTGESPELTKNFAKRITSEEVRFAAEVAAEEKAQNLKRTASQREYMKEYGTLKEKELAIVQEYEKKIANARAEGDEYLAKSLEKKKDSEIDELRRQYSGLYALIFADAQDLTNSQLARAIEVTQVEIQKAANSGDIERLAELYEQLNEAMSEQNNRKHWGFGGLAAGIRQLNEASKAFEKAQASNDGPGTEKAIAEGISAKALIKKSGDEIEELFGKLGDALKSFGGVAAEIGEVFDTLSANTQNFITAFTSKNKGDLAGVALDGLLQIATMVGNQIAENKKVQDEWNEAIRQSAHEFAMLELEGLNYQQANIFDVENPYKEAIDSMYKYSEAMKKIQEQQKELEAGQVQTGTKKQVSWKNVVKGAITGAVAGAAGGSLIPGLGTLWGALIGGISGAIAGAASRETVPIFENLVSQYGSILKEGTESFELNPKILADYGKLDEATKKLVDNWEELRKTAVEAQNQMRESLTDLVGETGDQLSNMLKNAFINGDAYDAVEDFHDYVSDMIEDLTQQLIFSAIFQKEFDKLQKNMEASFDIGGDQDIRDDLANFSKELPGFIDAYVTAMQQAQEAAKQMGFDIFTPDMSTQSLGDGIKRITEDTAGLLGSYLNGIRSDVSFMRTLQAQHLPIISAAVPSLMQYQAQIAANTANMHAETMRIAQSNEMILSELQSVITHDGPAAIRTY